MENRFFEEEELARKYQQYRVDYAGTGIDQEIVTFLRQRLPKEANSTVVDVACGTGFLTRVLAPHFDRVIGVDCSRAQLKVAEENTSSKNIEYRVAFAEDLGFISDASLDVVTVSLAIHYLDIEKFSEEVDRVLKPGGVLVLNIHHLKPGDGIGLVDVKLTPDTTDDEVLRGCQGLLDEVNDLAIQGLPSTKTLEALKDDVFLAFKPYEHHKVIVPAARVGNIDTVIGFISALGTVMAYYKAHPEMGDVREAYRNRLLALLGKVSPVPEEVKLTISTDFQCHMFRKPRSTSSEGQTA